jgi:sigma-B regulation protein RsbU (phosphoserine phosphatase)
LSRSTPDPDRLPPDEDLEDLYENAPCGYVSIRPDGRIAKSNATFSRWIGYPKEELDGKRVQDLLHVAGKIYFDTHFAPLLRMQGYFDEVALEFIAKDGTRLPTLVNAAERRDADNGHLFTRLTVFRATARRRYEGELKALRAASLADLTDERATAALREQFIAVLGHDLRNPLSAIVNGTDALQRMELDLRASMLVGMMRRSAERMSHLIDDVMDFARGRLSGGFPLERSANAPVEAVLRQVVHELQVATPGREIAADISIEIAVDCDSRRIGQLASNLLANALTYGTPGVPVRFVARAAGGAFELHVANAGTPIPPATLARIFQPFTRGEDRPSRQGLGLGLYIAHQVAVAHGGTLEAESTAEETRFTFRMPASMRIPTGEGG